jgi:hypothetical protein
MWPINYIRVEGPTFNSSKHGQRCSPWRQVEPETVSVVRGMAFSIDKSWGILRQSLGKKFSRLQVS